MPSYYYKATGKANFKTAYLVREEVVEASVSVDCKVGDVVTIANEGTASAKIDLLSAAISDSVSNAGSTNYPLAKASVIASISAGQLIIAQADQTMLGYKHIPVENRDYRYDPKVASCSTTKKIAVFRIRDLSDLNLDADTVDVYSA